MPDRDKVNAARLRARITNTQAMQNSQRAPSACRKNRRLLCLCLAFATLLLCGVNGQALFADTHSTTAVNADYVKVFKAKREMRLYHAGKSIKKYRISLGDNPIGHKQQQGDERTPEGVYTIDYRNPKSSYHLSLHINYPNREDKRKAAKRGVNPGGDIFIHGLPNGMGAMPNLFFAHDWTDGCIAVNNREIEEIWRLVKNGTPIEILP